jgi:hypothetical protein
MGRMTWLIVAHSPEGEIESTNNLNDISGLTKIRVGILISTNPNASTSAASVSSLPRISNCVRRFVGS